MKSIPTAEDDKKHVLTSYTFIVEKHVSLHSIYNPRLMNYVPSQPRLSGARAYPIPQEHSKEPSVLVHVWLHPPLLVRHSSTSILKLFFSYLNTVVFFFLSLPLQSKLLGAKLYPVPQEHSKEPIVLVHVWLHPPLLVRHSSTSINKVLEITCIAILTTYLKQEVHRWVQIPLHCKNMNKAT